MTDRVRDLGLIAVFSALVLLAAACGSGGGDTVEATSGPEDAEAESTAEAQSTEAADPAASGEPIEVGVIMSLTGTAGSSGIGLANAQDLAAKLINNDGGVQVGDTSRELVLTRYDDQGTAEGGIAAITKMYEQDGVRLEVGTIASSVGVGMLPFIQRHPDDLVVIFTGASAAELTEPPNAFRMAISSPVVGTAHAEYAATQDWTSMVDILDSTNAGQVAATEGFFADLDSNGVEVLSAETVERGQTDFTSIITKVQPLNPDFVELRLFPDETVLFIKQAREVGWDVPFLAVSNVTSDQVEGTLTPEQLTAVHQAGWATVHDLISADVDGGQELADAYREEFGDEAGFLTMQGVEGINSLAAAIEQAGSAEPADVLEAMSCLQEYERMVWPLTLTDDGCVYDENGETGVPIAVSVWTDGELEFVELLQ